MKQFTVYITESGEIKRFGICQDKDFNKQAKDGESVIEGMFDSNLYYVDIDAEPIQVKQKTEFADVYDRKTFIDTEIVFNDLPNPTEIYVDDDKQTVLDGSFEVAFSNIGVYRLTFSSLTKLKKGVRVEVSA